jgi:hypothetical protein
MSVLLIPSQWTGIATDPSFSGWVAPLANELGGGTRLYEYGEHMPLPPLSYMVVYWLSHGHAIWLTESTLHHLCTVASTLVMFLALRRVFRRPVPILATAGALAAYTGCDTILFYNSLANLFAALMGAAALRYKDAAAFEQPGVSNRASNLRWLGLLGALGAGAVLSKQSIGGPAIIGTAVFLAVFPTQLSFRERLARVAGYATATLAASALFCVIMLPWVDPVGMIRDVFLTGSQCKGGTAEIFLKIAGFSRSILTLFCVSFCALSVIILPKLRQMGLAGGNSIRAPGISGGRNAAWFFGALSCLVFVAVLLWRRKGFYSGLTVVQDVGFACCLFGLAGAVFRHAGQQEALDPFRTEPWLALGALTCVLLPAAIGYNLSGPVGQRELGWNIHTIPFLQVALAPLFWVLTSGLEKFTREWIAPSRAVASALLVAVLLAVHWLPWGAQWHLVSACRDKWPECSWFNGARVTVAARPLREVVKQVRKLAKPDERVLLLPGDPNLQASFERPRPRLSCAIIYTDQYWPKYVAGDYAKLVAEPPKVIAIGPAKDWRPYSRHRNDSRSAEALIDLIQTRLLPEKYRLDSRITINLGGAADEVEIYVRND